jgi:hypothetical protein
MDTKAYASLLAEIHCGILARISQGSYTLNGVATGCQPVSPEERDLIRLVESTECCLACLIEN